ncbi:DUF302 domain-containing protein [Arthrobacter sp. BB-1]|jgi:uncharacterized protein (DUF302 family)|uniref:DUF302 domain-containing protein n=1 Tax=Micrococcaceae TaxID=1268 RepID=UPI001112226E|nr:MULTISPECIES: DUF302 domain-containing protein [Micrococcaceae]TNB68365.1 DUF302 domain-containing protein [Arthrobacter sp. BB-1]UEL28532.1 DUF302 domain-containing protein [Pseudarthrobacter sp. L1SW]
MTYTLTTTVALPWTEALDRAREALSAQGFGILTEINVRSTFEAKLGAEAADAVGDYVILGACNPALASRALAAEPEIGALLPCNVVVRRSKDANVTTVEAIDPQTMVQLSGAPAVKEVADDAGARLRKALADLGEATG